MEQASCFEHQPLFSLNEALNNIQPPHDISEPSIERHLKILEDSNASDRSYYWLMTARIFELALLYAGHCADNCEFSAAGDLLVNPRRILIHRKGFSHSTVKQRHCRISDQLNAGKGSRERFLLLFKNEVTVEIAKPAILPYLYERMEQSRRIAPWYLNSAKQRMNQIADTIGFLSAWSLSSFEDFHKRKQMASPETGRFIDDNLCRFDRQTFERLGNEIQKAIHESSDASKFLTHH